MLFVFMSQPDFACNPHALWDYIIRNTDHKTAWIVKKKSHYDELTSRGIACAVYDTLDAQSLIEKADYIIQNTYTFPAISKREGQVLVNLWHGSGVKAHDLFNYDLDPTYAKKLENYFAQVDLMCVHSLDDRFKLSAMLGCDLRKIYVTGQARLDLVSPAADKNKLKRLFGSEICRFDRLIFFAPSFRANMSSHAGKLLSDNIFRLDDYNDDALNNFLMDNNAAIIYKLHPVEQTAFSGRSFEMNNRCFELTDEMLFKSKLRYDEILGNFDVMISDYSSIAYDFLLLDRPIVYLIPDYEEYKNSKGFVFNNIDVFMPGSKAYSFGDLINCLSESFDNPDTYSEQRKRVIEYRFDHIDHDSAKRCYERIISFKKTIDPPIQQICEHDTKMPSVAEHLSKHFSSHDLLIDSTKPIDDDKELIKQIDSADHTYYITSELPDRFRTLSDKTAYRINNLNFYNKIIKMTNVNIVCISSGVDYEFFSLKKAPPKDARTRIGFAGTIDDRIYFAMVQCVCEAFHDYDIVFAGNIIGDYPTWLNSYKNLKYINVSYDNLPEIINSFDVAFLPIYGKYKEIIPIELYQYLACGKVVVASDIIGLPKCKSIFSSSSVANAVDNIRLALKHADDTDYISAAKSVAQCNDWKIIAKRVINNN